MPKDHVHNTGCYRSELNCSTSEHNHDDHCQNYKGALTCGRTEHRHNYGDCYRDVLNCGQ